MYKENTSYLFIFKNGILLSKLYEHFNQSGQNYLPNNNFSDETVTVSTPSGRTWTNVWLSVDRTDWTFNVKACKEASLALAPAASADLPAYEIIIGAGNNDATSISRDKGGTAKTNDRSPNVLDCNTPRPFWVSWTNGVIAVSNCNCKGITTFRRNFSTICGHAY